MIKIKYDNKILLAFEDGLNDGAMNFTFDLKPNDKYHTQKESKAYNQGFKLACSKDYFTIWKNKKHCFDVIEYAIKVEDIKPIGWKLSRCIESEFQPFIEEIS